MLAGKHPFKDKSAPVTMSRILLGDPSPTERFQTQVSSELQAVLNKMLRKEKADRYQSAQDFLTDLRQLPSQHPLDRSTAESSHTKEAANTANAAGGLLSRIRDNKWPLLAAVLALVLIGVGLSKWFSAERSESLAILPFTYSSIDPKLMANPDREYLSDGMTESIINNLSQLTNLKVIARSSVFRYKGKDMDVQTIGRELNVRSVLVGQIKQDGAS
jgi:serine/threonine protein kinase